MLRKGFILLFVFILSSLAILAQEDSPNDPNVNEDANACFESGNMAGRCNIDFNHNGVVDDYEIAWAWECGWYLIRYDYGIFSEIPERCQHLLASEVPSEDEDTRVLCIQ